MHEDLLLLVGKVHLEVPHILMETSILFPVYFPFECLIRWHGRPHSEPGERLSYRLHDLVFPETVPNSIIAMSSRALKWANTSNASPEREIALIFVARPESCYARAIQPGNTIQNCQKRSHGSRNMESFFLPC